MLPAGLRSCQRGVWWKSMRLVVVRPGDSIASIAQRSGVDAELLWQHDGNRELRSRRSDPELLAPGDVVRVPDAHRGALEIEVGSGNRFRARVPSVTVRVAIEGLTEDIAGQPFEV